VPKGSVRTLSKIVEQINWSEKWKANLLCPDAPAVQLCRQSNAGLAMPYECVCSEVALFGLSEPSLPVAAATPSGGLAYQVREFLQAIAERKRSDCHRRAMTGVACRSRVVA
jgi:hypothetical protein